MASQFVTGHLANGMDEISAVEILESVLVWVMGIGLMMEVGSRRVLNPILITSILKHSQLM